MIFNEKEAFSFDDVILEPLYSGLKTRGEVSLDSFMSPRIPISIPMISSNMDTITESKMCIAMYEMGGIGILHRNLTQDKMLEEIKKIKSYFNKTIFGVSVGVKGSDLDRVTAAVEQGASCVVIDVAHAHSKLVGDFIKLIKKFCEESKVDIIAGNVCTKYGTEYLIDCGANCIKVGIGPGAVCTTRVVTGHGIPQLTAIIECKEQAGSNVIIADGGIRSSGDIVKALAAGADSVMIGNLFSGTEESPHLEMKTIKQKNYYSYRGMSSLEVNLGNKEEFTPEGISGFVPDKGSVKNIIRNLSGGIRSGISYSGCKNIKELQKMAVFRKISRSSLIESHPHDVLE